MAFLALYNIREPQQTEYDNHDLFYVAMDNFFELHYQRQDDIKELEVFYKALLERFKDAPVTKITAK